MKWRGVRSCKTLLIASLIGLMGILEGASGITAQATSNTKQPLKILKENSYEDYLEKYKEKPKPDKELVVDLKNLAKQEGEIEILNDYEGKTGVAIKTGEEGYVEWEIDVAEEGLYNIGVKYYPIKGKNSAAVREIKIDNEVPFSEASHFTFTRIWKDDNPGVQDQLGNEIKPTQVETPAWQSVTLEDYMGYSNDPIQFYFTKGKHTIRISSVREPLVIGEVKLFNEKEILNYETVSSQYKDSDYIKNEFLKIQGENTLFKSEPTIYPTYDRSSPATEPYDVAKIRLNTIGGEKWKEPGQWVSWEVEVPTTGLYKIGIKSRQNINDGMYTTRKLLIDGKVPFEEAEQIQFQYSTDWKMKVIGGADPYMFYLEKGKHIIQLSTTLGELGNILRTVEESVYELNDDYRKILMITGNMVDVFRDYNLDKQIPDVVESFLRQSEILGDISKNLEEYLGGKNSNIAIIDKTAYQLNIMGNDPDKIMKQFNAFKTNIGALATWIMTMREQPLEIDYFVIASAEQNIPKAEAGFFAHVLHEMRSFVTSFTEDYNTLGSLDEEQKSITVWIGNGITGGRDQAQIIKQMIQDEFTAKSGINVNLQLIAAGTLLPATLAGKGPDVALQIAGAEPVNYAIRNAVADLSQFEGFEEVVNRFHPSALTPYSFDGGTYALPETQSFPVLFYRTDIMEMLGLEIPDTWEDVFDMLPELQKRNLNFGFPCTTKAGAYNLNAYTMLLFQNGGTLYTENGKASNLDSELALNVFKDWTEFFTVYRMPVEYDFVNRFRVGEIPIGIADYTTYNQLSVSAPEIRGLWSFAPVPGTVQKDGTIDRSVVAGGAGCIMMQQSENKKDAWEFMKWWTDVDTQVRFGQELESILGSAARYNTANIKSLEQLPWPSSDLKILNQQWEWTKGMPELPGSYYTPRNVEFAFKAVINSGEETRDSLLNEVRVINEEITAKRKEFGYDIDED